MDSDMVTIARFLAAGLAINGVIGPALAIGNIVRAATQAIARNPDAASKIQTAMILGIAPAEGLGVFALVIAIMLLFKIGA